jgi:predicted acyl esterase
MILCIAVAIAVRPVLSQDSLYVRQHYVKREVMVPVRDGVRLFTSMYVPVDTTRTYPIMLNRTPYGVRRTARTPTVQLWVPPRPSCMEDSYSCTRMSGGSECLKGHSST